MTTAEVDAWQAWIGCSSRDAAARDALLTRLAIGVALHPYLGSELVLRGGFALHHLVLPRPARCCTSLEYARCSGGPIGPVLDALRDVATSSGSRVRTEVRDRPRIYVRATSDPLVRNRARVDLETRETRPLQPFARRPLSDPNGFAAGTEALTYQTEDLLGFLLREVYRRSRSRDLFDIWIGLTRLDVDDGLVLASFRQACELAELGGIGRGAFRARLHRHLERAAFARDLAGLPGSAAGAFDAADAASIVVTRLIDRLPGL
jgi:hypothetical protein